MTWCHCTGTVRSDTKEGSGEKVALETQSEDKTPTEGAEQK